MRLGKRRLSNKDVLSKISEGLILLLSSFSSLEGVASALALLEPPDAPPDGTTPTYKN